MIITHFAHPSVNEVEGVTLRCDLDLLYKKLDVAGSSELDVFVHGLHLFTGIAKNPRRYEDDSSLLEPLSLRIKKSNDASANESSLKVDSEIVRARAKYTDMSLAVDVALQLVADFKSDSSDEQPTPHEPKGPQDEGKKSLTSVHCGGASLLVIDNSERHFSGAQELVQLSLAGIEYEERIDGTASTTEVILRKLEMVDFLQPLNSPFRLAACSYENDFERSMGDAEIKADEGRLAWAMFVVKEKEWGYESPPPISPPTMTADQQNRSLIALGIASSPERKTIDLKCDTVAFQWNPSTIIALQRFAGRLRKEVRARVAKRRAEKAYSREISTPRTSVCSISTVPPALPPVFNAITSSFATRFAHGRPRERSKRRLAW